MKDVIYRQDAIDAFDAQCWERINIPICKEIRNAAKDTIKKLPSAQPERKTGKWIFPYETTTMVTHCSECGAYGNKNNNFCPHCGADMRGEQDEQRD